MSPTRPSWAPQGRVVVRFRLGWRDALRRIDVQPATLQALGAWSQGTLISDDYGDKSDPDHQTKYMEQITFPGLDLAMLYPSAYDLHRLF